ncbi:uncharacterized protein LOC110435829 [Sorghum bicolor]|uniref:Knottin scorpion toxin-like domain-containing protein n=1 Tax=Sorghum bicolor TaxID=4558 RepID=A0A1B6PTG2_SORBI|nr:uncharacterized protein LOC110435829 [Sorghum bicolor]KXG28958.1 hypothetical protein SORBI_3005G189600 [Sorghum bicolor]|eukprot:XP_021317566.1 uncharacterized protein LOC110435829 [Sorghum bicolor]
MACKVIIAAAAAALMLSFLLPSEVVGREHIGNCPFWRSQVPECRTRMSCIKRCQDEGYKGGFCDGNKICMCSQCSDSTDDPEIVAASDSAEANRCMGMIIA